MLLWASKLGTAKIECSFEMGKYNPSGVASIYFAADSSYIRMIVMNENIVFLNRYLLLRGSSQNFEIIFINGSILLKFSHM